MANLASAKKHIRADARKRARNRWVRSRMRTAIKKARAAILAHDENAWELLRQAVSQIDKAAKKGVIKKNNAARRKSRLMRLYNKEIAAADQLSAAS